MKFRCFPKSFFVVHIDRMFRSFTKLIFESASVLLQQGLTGC